MAIDPRNPADGQFRYAAGFSRHWPDCGSGGLVAEDALAFRHVGHLLDNFAAPAADNSDACTARGTPGPAACGAGFDSGTMDSAGRISGTAVSCILETAPSDGAACDGSERYRSHGCVRHRSMLALSRASGLR